MDDYQIGLRHGLEQINVMAPDGTISDKYGWPDAAGTDAEQLLGMDRFEAREAIVEWFRQENLLEDVREYTHQVGHSYRSHVPIEPYLSDQWYIAVKKPISELAGKFGEGMIDGTDVPVNSLAGLALQPVLDGRLRFVPKRYAGVYRSWLENLRDWPISRQLWWGHQIPIWNGSYEQFQAAFNCSLDADGKPGKITIDAVEVACILRTEQDDTQHVYVSAPGGHESVEQKLEQAGLQRDPDVLDTWFSSAPWPFSTMGWPEKTPELGAYYPGNVLCTAREIITLWVSRMVMMGQYCAGDIPFSDVFIHAMIQDGEGRKMSKSLGNGIDPLVVIDSHGADAMRFTLASMTTQTQDVRMPVKPIKLPDGRTVNTSEKFDIGRNFCNKLWNASRFAMMNLDAAPTWSDIHPKKHLADRWILSRLSATIRDVTASIDSYRFNELADTIYHFMWDDFCDWYLEIAKVRINAGERTPKAVLAHVLDVLLRLLHPICPFITESIWQNLNKVAPNRGPGDLQAEAMLIRAQWPQADAAAINEPAERQFDVYREAVRNTRNVRAEHGIPPKNRIAFSVSRTGAGFEVIQANKELFEAQAAGDVTFVGEDYKPPADAASVGLSGGTTGYIEGAVDKDAELARLTKQRETLTKGISSIEAKLHNESFVAKAPPEVVKRERERLALLYADLAALKKSLEGLSS